MRVSTAPPARTWRPAFRLTFALAWITVQVVLILTASHRADAAFGFRMFAESSTVVAHLSRDIEAPSGHGMVTVAVPTGEWIARGRDGYLHPVRWRDRVIESNLSLFEVTLHASYSAAAQVERWHAALDDVAAHLEGDAETKELHLDLVVQRNGREAVTYHFDAAPAPR